MEELPVMPLGRAQIDRMAMRRREDDLLVRLRTSTEARTIVVAGGKVLADDDGRLRYHAPVELRAQAGEWSYQGQDDAGADYLALVMAHPAPGLDGGTGRWLDIREIGAGLSDAETGLAASSLSLGRWQLIQRYCPACGSPTELVEAGWAARCPADGSVHYPRTDPAVIMAIVDEEDRLLLGRGRAWHNTKRYSILAGYVEAGEALEAAVRREVAEEAGVEVGAVRYLGNQPWPPSGSLMVAFVGRALTTELTIDPEELDDVRWCSRAQLDRAVARGEIELPPPAAIAHAVIGGWRSGAIRVGALPGGDGLW